MWGRIRIPVGVLVLVNVIFLISACFHEVNHPPTANAGANVSTAVTSKVKLDGSNSSDVDGDRLSYQWEITQKPESSTAVLSDKAAVNPELVIDATGLYVIRLIVSDGDSKSKPDFVSVNSFNEKPNAVILETSFRNGENYVIGDRISLDAVQSSDPESQDLFYNWELAVKPENSSATLSSYTAINPFFIVDQPGFYIVHLIVNDGANLSEPEMKIFEIEQPVRKTDNKPFAEAGLDQALFVAHRTVQLDGSRSYDIENDALSFRWELIYKPKSSTAVLEEAFTSMPTFFADVLGSYVAQLIVSDNSGDSHLDTIIVTPHAEPQLACGDCHDNINVNGVLNNHLLTYDDCFQCHFIDKWKPSKGARHFHSHSAQPAQCQICHDGRSSTGKAANHLVTEKDCNYCHQIADESWLPASTNPVDPEFNHKGIYYGCAACHDNVFQQGKPEGHMPTSDRCLACHLTSTWQSDLHLEHTQVFGECNLCHN